MVSCRPFRRVAASRLCFPDNDTKVQRKSPGSNSDRGFNTILTHYFFDDNSVIILFDDN